MSVIGRIDLPLPAASESVNRELYLTLPGHFAASRLKWKRLC